MSLRLQKRIHHLPFQRHLITHLVPIFQEWDHFERASLTGSLALEKGDRWSSVELVVELSDGDDSGSIPEMLGDELFSRIDQLNGVRPLRVPVRRIDDILDSLIWISLDTSDESRAWSLVHLVIAQRVDPGASVNITQGYPQTALFSRDGMIQELDDEPSHIGPSARRLGDCCSHFWVNLYALAGALNRADFLAASAAVEQARHWLIEIVIGLNGAGWSNRSGQAAIFLGPEQRAGLESTLPKNSLTSEGWIGAGVALVVLYRWYAPQVAQRFNFSLPADLESLVLQYLHREVPGWPFRIQTG